MERRERIKWQSADYVTTSEIADCTENPQKNYSRTVRMSIVNREFGNFHEQYHTLHFCGQMEYNGVPMHYQHGGRIFCVALCSLSF